MDEESDDCLLAAAAIAIIVRRRRHTRRRVLWSRQWLVDRSSERGIQHFLDYELVDDFCGFHGFLRPYGWGRPTASTYYRRGGTRICSHNKGGGGEIHKRFIHEMPTTN